MTVDETPLSPPTAEPSTSNITKKVAQEQGLSPAVRGLPSQQHHGPAQGKRAMNFGEHLELNTQQAQKQLNQVAEVTGIRDKNLLMRAFDESRIANQDFNVENAIVWILNHSDENSQYNTQFPALDQSKKLNRASNVATGPVTHVPVSTVSSHVGSTPGVPPNSPKSGTRPLVDLTENSGGAAKDSMDDDLQKAIKLSLEEANRTAGNFGGGQISQEDQDVSRALEASLLESQLGPGKRKRAETWCDPLNPHDRERNGVWPVGLKNVGQTCWFSAVVQSLFYLPVFRSLVLGCVLNLGSEAEDSNKRKSPPSALDDHQRKIEFMQELRKLFALLIASQRKYVDPSNAIDILRGHIGGGNTPYGPANQNASLVHVGDNDQQDVSEFTHIMLEWVEEAFKKSEITSSERAEMMEECSNEKENSEEKDKQECKDNPMADLFYGKVRTEGNINGSPFSRIDAFGQWPLQVNSFSDIHDSLENSTARESLNVSSTVNVDIDSSNSGQERWFTQLPPVLFLELSRFHYNTEKKLAEKIHNRLDFPETIFMDRYMITNKDITRAKREQVRNLKEKRKLLMQRLEKFTNYDKCENDDASSDSSSGSKMSLPDVLQRTLAFATSGVKEASHPKVDPLSKPVMSVMMQVDSPCPSPKMTPASSLTNIPSAVATAHHDQEETPMEVEGCDDEPHSGQHPEPNGCEGKVASQSDKEDCVPEPIPRFISEEELKVLKSCLLRWKEEVEEDMKSLEASILSIEKTIEEMYDSEAELRKYEYRLHAVMVHEGSIDSGHYWVYVRDHKRKTWLKFNDNTVTEVTWQELLKESVGGHSNTSAYSLVYTDTSKSDLLWDESESDQMEETPTIDLLLKTLPQDLADFVQKDNQAFQQEIVLWDKKQLEKQQAAVKTQKEQQTEAAGSQDPNNDVQVVQEKLTYTNTHACLTLELCQAIIHEQRKFIEVNGIDKSLKMLIQKVIEHFTSGIKKEVSSFPPTTSHEIAPTDIRLESFVAYLLKNNASEVVVELASLEQFAHPSLDSNDVVISNIRKTAEQWVNEKRLRSAEAAKEIREWHQIYHWFRRSAHCYVNGLEAFHSHKFEKSLDHLTEAYIYTIKILESNITAQYKHLNVESLNRFVCLILPEVNHSLIVKFQKAESLSEVVKTVQELVTPALNILQNRSSCRLDSSASHILETIRNDWCGLLSDAREDSTTSLSEILTLILDSDSMQQLPQRTNKNMDVVNLTADMNLNKSYCRVVAQVRQELPEQIQED